MWWDLDDIGRYYIPKEGSATSLFSGALWIGGTDVNGQLKLAAQRYRQVGIDYWPGPLTVDGTAAVDEETCVRYDQHTVITRAQVDLFLQWWNSENKPWSSRIMLSRMRFLSIPHTEIFLKTRVITWLPLKM